MIISIVYKTYIKKFNENKILRTLFVCLDFRKKKMLKFYEFDDNLSLIKISPLKIDHNVYSLMMFFIIIYFKIDIYKTIITDQRSVKCSKSDALSFINFRNVFSLEHLKIIRLIK